jgi:hypothetical protein
MVTLRLGIKSSLSQSLLCPQIWYLSNKSWIEAIRSSLINHLLPKINHNYQRGSLIQKSLNLPFQSRIKVIELGINSYFLNQHLKIELDKWNSLHKLFKYSQRNNKNHSEDLSAPLSNNFLLNKLWFLTMLHYKPTSLSLNHKIRCILQDLNLVWSIKSWHNSFKTKFSWRNKQIN